MLRTAAGSQNFGVLLKMDVILYHNLVYLILLSRRKS